MPKNGKIRSNLWLVLKSVVAGSVVVSRTFAAPAPMAPNHVGMVDGWRALGEQMRQDPSALPLLDRALVDMIAAANLDQDLTEIVLASYEMVDPSHVHALDAHWASVLTATGSAALVAEFLNIRASLGHAAAGQSDSDAVIWLASNHNHNGSCDSGCNNGWGNDDQCSPGNSGDNNNGENHGGGNTDGTADGSSNSSDNRKK